MPTYVILPDGTQKESSETIVTLPEGLDIRKIRIRWGEVSLFDVNGEESVLVQQGNYPGAGMDVGFGDHVILQEDQ